MSKKSLKAEIELLTRWNYSDKAICELLGLRTHAELRRLRAQFHNRF